MPLSQRHPAPPTDHPTNANPTFTKRCACAAKPSSTLQHVVLPRFSHESGASCVHPKSPPKASPTVSALATQPRTVANSRGRTRLYPQTPQSETRTLRYALGNKRSTAKPKTKKEIVTETPQNGCKKRKAPTKMRARSLFGSGSSVSLSTAPVRSNWICKNSEASILESSVDRWVDRKPNFWVGGSTARSDGGEREFLGVR